MHIISATVFLDLIGTPDIKHSKRTLFKHLQRTSELLQAWGEPSHVVLAGLFHSIYGTSQFKTCAFPFEGRHIIERLIGKEAELLAHEFCIANRRTFPWAMHHHPHQQQDLYTIEAANLIEQSSKPEHVAKLLTVPLSENARAAVQTYIKGYEPSHQISPHETQ